MAKKVLRSDVVEDGIFDNLKKSATDALSQIEKLQNGLKSTAKVLNEQLKSAQFGNAESINKFVQATEQANKVKKDSQKLDQESIQIQQQLTKLQQEEEKLKQQKMRTETQANREKERQAKASERAAKAAKDENSEYKKLVKSTRDLKNESKELAAQMLKLEQSGQKNTKAYRDLESQYKKVTRAAQQGDKALKKIDSTVGDNFRNVGNYKSALGGLKSMLGTLGVAFGARQLVSFGTESIELFREQQKAIAQVEAGLKSTGNTAGFTSKQLQEMASSLQKETIFGDEQILKDATAQLLTFTNISGEQFDRTQQAALDLATRLDGDLKSASIQLGKALNDPVANLSALSRSGIQFSEDQKAVIKSLTESGRLAEAQTLILDELNKQYGGSAKAAAEADGGIQQLKNAIGDAKEEFGRYLLEALKPTIQGLKDFFSNLKPEDIKRFVSTLGSIVSVLGKVVQGFIIFKTTMAALKLADQIKNFKTWGGTIKTAGGSLNKAQESAKNFGRSLKAIGWSVAIGLAIELANGFLKIANGAMRAEREMQKINAATEKATEGASETIAKLNKATEERISNLRNEMELGKISKEEFLKQQNQIRNEEKKTLESYIKTVEKRRTTRQKEYFQAKSDLKDLGLSYEQIAGIESNMNLASAELARSIGLEGILPEKKTKILEAIDRFESAKAAIEGTQKRIEEYTKAVEENGKSTSDAIHEYEMYNKELSETAKNAKDASDEIGRLSRNREKVDKIIKDPMRVEANDYDSLSIVQRAIFDEFIDIEKAKRLQLLKSGATEDQIRQEMLKVEITNLEERKRILKELGEDTIDVEIEIEEKRRQLKEANGEQNLAIDKEYIDLATEYFIKRSNERIEQIKKEIEASQNQYDTLKRLAEEGNIDAKESLAEQQRIIAEANRAKEAEQRRQERIKLAQAAYEAYERNANDETVSNPLAKTITDITLLRQFLQSIPAFMDGTEDTGANGIGVDGKGGFHAILHPNERVMTKEQNAMVGSLTNEQLAKVALDYNTGKMIAKGDAAVAMYNPWESALLIQKIDELNATIRNKPETNIELERIVDGAMTITRSTKKGNTLIYNRHKVK